MCHHVVLLALARNARLFGPWVAALPLLCPPWLASFTSSLSTLTQTLGFQPLQSSNSSS